MIEHEPSKTAFAAATHRALHQVLEGGRVFSDPIAVRILGVSEAELRASANEQDAQRGIRFFISARARLTEDAARDAVEQRGVGQLVVLGAGLDTFGYRHARCERLRVFEVDHPATQAWKQRRLCEAEIEVPGNVTYVPVDFERDSLTNRLAAAGLRPEARTYWSWLGVVPYLSREAIRATLAMIAAHPGGAEVAFDYGEPREAVDPEFRAEFEEREARAAAAGEPFLSWFAPDELHALLQKLGFRRVEDLDVAAMLARLFGPENAARRPRRDGAHLVLAATESSA